MDPESILDFTITNAEQADFFNSAVQNGFLAKASQVHIYVVGDERLARMVGYSLGLQYLTPGHAKWFGDSENGRVIELRERSSLGPGYKKVDIYWVSQLVDIGKGVGVNSP